MLDMFESLGMLCVYFAYASLTLDSRGPAGGPLDRMATSMENIAYVSHILCICSADISMPYVRPDTPQRARLSVEWPI